MSNKDEAMSDPIEKQWEQYQNGHCDHCAQSEEYQGDYVKHPACKSCRDACEEQERDKVEGAREAYWDHKFMESRGEK